VQFDNANPVLDAGSNEHAEVEAASSQNKDWGMEIER